MVEWKKISSQRALEYVLLTENSMVVMRGKGGGEIVKGVKYMEKRRFDFRL